MEFEKLQDIIADVLNVQKEDIKPEARIPWIFSRSSWGSRKSSTSRSTMMKQRR